MKSLRELEELVPEQIDMNDPEIPETLKIRARVAKENADRERLERYAYERTAQEGTESDMQRTTL